MSLEDEEYRKWLKEEFNKEPNKPSGMFSTWGWYLKKELEFKKILKNRSKRIG